MPDLLIDPLPHVSAGLIFTHITLSNTRPIPFSLVDVTVLLHLAINNIPLNMFCGQ